MIVLTPEQKNKFGNEVRVFPYMVYEPIEIANGDFILGNEAEDEVIKKGIIGYDKREILVSELKVSEL